MIKGKIVSLKKHKSLLEKDNSFLLTVYWAKEERIVIVHLQIELIINLKVVT